MTNTVRYGLVGSGMMGVEHIHNLAITPGAVVMGPNGVVELKRRATGDRVEVPIDSVVSRI